VEAIKRLEIITDAIEIRLVVETLEAHGLTGYTIVPNVTGRGERGRQRGDDMSGVFQNSYLLTTCPPGRVEEIVNAIRPLLQKRGGVCLVSDAHWVVH
jgi:nitrogen regulatory protein PII